MGKKLRQALDQEASLANQMVTYLDQNHLIVALILY